MRKGRKGKTEMGTNAFSSLPYVINTRTEQENLPFQGEGLELLLQAVGAAVRFHPNLSLRPLAINVNGKGLIRRRRKGRGSHSKSPLV